MFKLNSVNALQGQTTYKTIHGQKARHPGPLCFCVHVCEAYSRLFQLTSVFWSKS